MRRCAGRSGFTLLEILITVAIGLLLMFIILPIFSAARMKSKRTLCLSNLRQVGIALQLYAQDNEDLLPPWRNTRVEQDGRSTRWDSPENLYMALTVKIRDPRLTFCTIDPYAGKDVQAFGVNHRLSSFFFNTMSPDDAGTLTITGLLKGGQVEIPPADYMLVRDSNLGYRETVDGEAAYGCQHLSGVNIIYCDMHAEFHKVKDGSILK